MKKPSKYGPPTDIQARLFFSREPVKLQFKLKLTGRAAVVAAVLLIVAMLPNLDTETFNPSVGKGVVAWVLGNTEERSNESK